MTAADYVELLYQLQTPRPRRVFPQPLHMPVEEEADGDELWLPDQDLGTLVPEVTIRLSIWLGEFVSRLTTPDTDQPATRRSDVFLFIARLYKRRLAADPHLKEPARLSSTATEHPDDLAHWDDIPYLASQVRNEICAAIDHANLARRSIVAHEYDTQVSHRSRAGIHLWRAFQATAAIVAVYRHRPRHRVLKIALGLWKIATRTTPVVDAVIPRGKRDDDRQKYEWADPT